MDVLTNTTSYYLATFRSFLHYFLDWGQMIFGGLLSIQTIWLTFWYAFEREAITQSLVDFLKQSFSIFLFYSLMIHTDWLFSMVNTAQVMGQQLTGVNVDPSAIIANGIMIANKILDPLKDSSLLTEIFGHLVAYTVYIVILFAFISIALELALTMILVTALITVSPFFLSFSALQATSPIARQTLDTILGYSVKLLGLYIVIAVGGQTIHFMSAQIPHTLESFDPYIWLAATALLFSLTARHLPNQLMRLVGGQGGETHHGTNMAGVAWSGVRIARILMPAVKAVGSALAHIGKTLGSVIANSAAHLRHQGFKRMVSGTFKDVGKAVGGSLSDRFKHMSNLASGGKGLAGAEPMASVAERVHLATQQVRQSKTPEFQ